MTRSDPGLPGRRLFLRAVSEVEPAVLQALRDRVLPLVRAAFKEDRRSILASAPATSPVWEDVNRELMAWAEFWHLRDDWILEAAVGTAHSWDGYLYRREELPMQWLFGSVAYGWPERLGTLSEWNPATETLKEAARRLGRQLRDYLDRVEQLAKRQGYEAEPPTRRRKGTGPVPRKYYWLAKFQVKKMTYAKIAGAEANPSADPRSVADAIRDLSDQIGLTLRSQSDRG